MSRRVGTRTEQCLSLAVRLSLAQVSRPCVAVLFCILVDVCDVPIKSLLQLLLIAAFLRTMTGRGRAKYFVGTQRAASFHGNVRQPFGDADSRFLHFHWRIPDMKRY